MPGTVDRLLDGFDDLVMATDDPLPLRVSHFIVGHEHRPVTFTPTGRLAG